MVADVSSDNTVIKLSTGALTFCGLDNQYTAPTLQAERTAALAQYVESLGASFLAAVAPEKIPPEGGQLPAGVNEYGNDYADAFLHLTAQAGVDTLDLRPAFLESGRWEDLFFVTDHHWNADGAFLAYQTLAAELEDRYGYVTAQVYTDPDSYERTVYEDLFLGSQGKRVGSLYAGVDDFAVPLPMRRAPAPSSRPYASRSTSSSGTGLTATPMYTTLAETSASPPSSMRVTPTDRLWFSCGSPFPAP